MKNIKIIGLALVSLCVLRPVYAVSDTVVLLHGIARSPASMHKLEQALAAEGYAVLNLGYPSTALPLEGIREYLHPRIEGQAKQAAQIHFVTHSMGGLVTRAYLHKYRPPNLGRVVMLSPPNHGSEVADFLTRYANWPYKWFYGPAGQQLTTSFNGKALFGEVFYPLGIITGDETLAPVSSWVIPGKDDGKVSIASSKLAGMAEHKVVPYAHTFMMQKEDVIKDVHSFLKTGHFLPDIPE